MQKQIRHQWERSGTLLFCRYRQFFLPTLLAGIATSMSIIVDSILVGNILGPSEMASVNLCMPVMQFFYMLSAWIGMGSSTLIAICFGKRDKENANRYFNIATWILLFLGLSITCFGFFYSGVLAGLITDNDLLMPFVESYLKILLIGCVPVLIVPAFVYIFRTDGQVRLASLILILANVLNLVLDVVFMGPLQMGIAGSSLATIVGYLGGAGLFSIYFFKRNRSFTLKFSIEWLKGLGFRLNEIFQTGLPAAMGLGFIAVKLFFMNHIIEDIGGSDGLVIFSICLSCLSFISIFISSSASTMMPIVGTLWGENDFLGIHIIVRYTLRFSLSISAIVIILFELFPAHIFYMFGIDRWADVITIGVNGLRIYAFSLLGVSVSFLMMYYYLTIRKSLYANIISASEGLFLPVPMAWIGSEVLGLNGVWIAFILTEVITMIIICGIVYHERKKLHKKRLGPLLIDEVSPEVLWDFSCNLNGNSRDVIVQNLKEEGKRRFPEFIYWNQAAEIISDLFQQIQQAASNSTIGLDIRLVETEDNFQLLIRDAGRTFSPVSSVMSATDAIEIKYSRVLLFNQTQILLKKQKMTSKSTR